MTGSQVSGPGTGAQRFVLPGSRDAESVTWESSANAGLTGPPGETPSEKRMCVHALSCFHPSVVSNSLRRHGPWPTRLLCPWDSPTKSTGVGCRFLAQGSSRPGDQTHTSLCLLHWQAGSLPPAPPGNPIITCLHGFSHLHFELLQDWDQIVYFFKPRT